MSNTQLRWGIRFPRPAAAAGGLPLIIAPVPERLVVPLNQNIGFASSAMVAVGERVMKGQPIGTYSGNAPAAHVHAPTSGLVTDLAVRPVTGRDSAMCIEIEADGQDQPWPSYAALEDPLHLPSARLREAVTEAGIVGLGGAMFPTSIKLNPGLGVTTLILNGVECEPRISCDDALMQNSADAILLGAQIMLRILEADECIIAIKEHTPAVEPMVKATQQLHDDRFTISFVPAVYPAGGEVQLIELLTGIEVPTGGLPWDTGVICQNVATAAAITTFLTEGEPLISRIVTVTGEGITQPVNVKARLGSPISHVVECAGGYTPTASRLIMGGPMMGIALPDDALPITKACNSIYVAGTRELAPETPEMPCIRCGECTITCPVDLMPQLLLQAKRVNDYERLEILGLPDCIECGCCDYVCPSHIALTREFRTAKQALWDIGFEKRRARLAAQRFSARAERLDRKTKQRDQELEQQIEALADSGTNHGDSARDALEQLLKRTKGADDKDEQP